MTTIFASRLGAGAHDGSSVANEFTLQEAVTYVTVTLAASAGIWVKYRGDGTTDSQSASADFSTASAATRTSPFVLSGYTTTIGDAFAGRTNGSQALITTYMPTIAMGSGFQLIGAGVSGAFCIVEGLTVTGTVTSGTPLSGWQIIRHCSVTNAGDNASATGISPTGTNFEVVDCDITCTGATNTLAGINVAATTNVMIDSCRVKTAKGPGITISTGSAHVRQTVAYKCGSHGLSITGTTGILTLDRCSLIGNTSAGLSLTANTTVLVRANACAFTDNGTYGIDSSGAGTAVVAYYCRYDRNTTNPRNIGSDYSAVEVGANTTSVLQAAEYTDYANNDFRRVAGSPGAGNGLMGGDIGSGQQASSSGGASGGRLGIGL